MTVSICISVGLGRGNLRRAASDILRATVLIIISALRISASPLEVAAAVVVAPKGKDLFIPQVKSECATFTSHHVH